MVALHLCLRLACVCPADKVVAPALTYVVTANAIIMYCRAAPHFVNRLERTLGIDATKLADHLFEICEVKDGVCRNRRTGRPICTVVPMCTFGPPIDRESRFEIASRYRLAVVDDSAESSLSKAFAASVFYIRI